jgi:hypothetical protein
MIAKTGSDNNNYACRSRGKGKYEYLHLIKAKDKYSGYVDVGHLLFPFKSIGKKVIIKIEVVK